MRTEAMGPWTAAEPATAGNTAAGRAGGHPAAGRPAAARCRARRCALRHRVLFALFSRSLPGRSACCSCVRGCRPGLPPTLMSLGRAVGRGPAGACHRAAPGDADGGGRARPEAASSGHLPSVPPDWVMPDALGRCAATRLWQEVSTAGGNLQALLGPYADWLRRASWPPRMRWRTVRCNSCWRSSSPGLFWAKGEALGAAMQDMVRRLGGRPPPRRWRLPAARCAASPMAWWERPSSRRS